MGLISLALAACVVASPVAAEPKIPLPQGVGHLADARKVQLGSSTLDVQGFTSTMSVETLERFYEEALPKAGWRLVPLPWQTQHLQMTARLEQTMKDDAEAAADPALQAKLADAKKTRDQMRRQLHAQQGDAHVVVQFMPLGQDQTAVFFNQWWGSADWVGSQPSGASMRVQAPGVQPNVCCSGEPVPDTNGPLPFAIPHYPGAKVIAKSASYSGQESVTLLLVTSDAASDVEAYYRKHMAYNGWQLVPMTERELAGGAGSDAMHLLRYRNAARLCGLTIGRAEAQTTIMVMVTPRPPYTIWTGK